MKIFYMKTEDAIFHSIPHLLNKKKDIDRSSALCSIKTPFELLHTDVADIHFFLGLLLTQLIVYLLLTYLLPKVILIQ